MDAALRRAPCLRGYARPSAAVLAVLGRPEAAGGGVEAGREDSPRAPPPEDVCAAELAVYCEVALRLGAGARVRGVKAALAAASSSLAAAAPLSPAAEADLTEAAAAGGARFVALLESLGLVGPASASAAPLHVGPDGLILSSRGGGGAAADASYGAIGGVGQWAVVRYSEGGGLAEQLLRAFSLHFRGGLPLTPEATAAARHIATAYSKARGAGGLPL